MKSTKVVYLSMHNHNLKPILLSHKDVNKLSSSITFLHQSTFFINQLFSSIIFFINQLFSSINFFHQSTFFINQLSSSINFLYQSTFFVNQYSLSINFFCQSTFSDDQLASSIICPHNSSNNFLRQLILFQSTRFIFS